jgi:hypothetical protein
MARHSFLARLFKGSSPFTPLNDKHSSMVECKIVALKVVGSSPIVYL